jgi:TonB-linked SusC/RagA family outer membrane protein
MKKGPCPLFLILLVCLCRNLSVSAQDSIPARDSIQKDRVETGYGLMEISQVTGSIVSLKEEDFNRGDIRSFESMIRGRVSGLSVSKSGADPAGFYTMRLRGVHGAYLNAEPLVVLDGIPGEFHGFPDPADIETITVLKDGASSAIFGMQGENGVILITTKKGRKGALHVSYDGYAATERVAKNTPVMNAAEWKSVRSELGDVHTEETSTDWFGEIEQNAFSQVHHLSADGTIGHTDYYVSAGYRDMEGILRYTGLKQVNGMVNIHQRAIHDRLQIDLQFSGTGRKNNFSFDEAFSSASVYKPVSPVKSNDPLYDKYNGYFQEEGRYGPYDNYYNPVSIIDQNSKDGTCNHLILSGKAGYELTKGLTLQLMAARRKLNTTLDEVFSPYEYWRMGYYGYHTAVSLEDHSGQNLIEPTLSYDGHIGSSIGIKAVIGYSWQKFSLDSRQQETRENTNGTEFSARTSESYLRAYFGTLHVAIKDRWYIDGSLRQETSSLLPDDYRMQLYPSIGTAWCILADPSAINLKIRASYGKTGNLLYNPVNQQYLSRQGKMQPHSTFGISYNPGIKPEYNNAFNIGIDFSLVHGRLTGATDYYYMVTRDVIMPVDVPDSWGDDILMNNGEIKSSGIEINIQAGLVEKPGFSWHSGITPYFVLSNQFGSLESGEIHAAYVKFGFQAVQIKADSPVGDIIAPDFIGIDENGNLLFTDADHNGYIDGRDYIVSGNGLPKFTLGWANDFKLGNWDLDIFFTAVTGHDLLNEYRVSYEYPSMSKDFNVASGTVDVINAVSNSFNGTLPVYTDFHVEHASYLSLDNVYLGYEFLKHANTALKSFRVYIAGNNLFYLSQYKGADPNVRYTDSDINSGYYNNAVVPGIDRMGSWARSRSFSLGLSVSL